jgi:hypothetical protein
LGGFRYGERRVGQSVQADQRELVPTVVGGLLLKPGERHFEFRIGQLPHFAIRNPHFPRGMSSSKFGFDFVDSAAKRERR